MKKIIIFACIFLFSSVSYSFDYSSYMPATLDDIIKSIDDEKKELMENKRAKGLTAYISKYRIPFKLAKYPVEMNKNYVKIIDFYEHLFSIKLTNGEKLSNLFGYQSELEYKGVKFVLLYQKSLIEYIKKEIALNESFNLYVSWGIHNDDSNVAILLVNEFQKIQTDI